ncbi:guanosine triphosphatase [Anguillid herpesvirus 1]|uniref:Guanosine triphosphatase n=1 Tax=Anguillid herpesvirus 1 TaxID=150286 RepID=A0A8E5EVQ4_9VIRU|nr:guanosine triphosphatase [Anguillid herpesvirus 1]ADA57778.1 guanosine triphosphatase [Anguillid herpesvirus 1]QRM16310.1 guanosine triphosphatase [Anguillid herpesvirus 1]QRM16569.1 guanosine triphosphatase [Anguillid herpesvirus 1]QRM16702.1 guanosine triphosphatase [Anguillid herpesvirus 1]QRM16963.1 guanosine triphosphatase [Anguillid herpesvirus 1]
MPTTDQCTIHRKTVNGIDTVVLDTPGWTGQDPDLQAVITDCVGQGPHAFILVLPVDRQTPQEREVVQSVARIFGEKMFNRTVLVFTFGDQLDDGAYIQDFVTSHAHLSDLATKCGDRVFVIDNKYWNGPRDPAVNNTVQTLRIWETIEELHNLTDDDGHHTPNQVQPPRPPSSLFNRVWAFFSNDLNR